MFDRRFDKLLIPYLEGSLDPQRRAMLEEAIANDSRLAEEVEEMRRLKYQLQRSASNFSNAGSNRSAWPGIEARIQASRAPVYRTTPFWGLGLAMGVAASLVICFGAPFMAQLGRMDVASTTDQNSTSIQVKPALQTPETIASLPSVGGFTATSGLSPMFYAPSINAPRPSKTSNAYISVPNILPVADHSTSAGNQVQLADADISHDSVIHGSIVSLAPYSMPFVEPSAEPVVDRPVQIQPQMVSANANFIEIGKPTVIADAVSAPAQPVQQSSAVMSAGLPMTSDALSAPATTMRLATMSTPTSTTDSSSSDTPLIAQLRTVDDQANTDATNGSQARALARWQSVLQATSSSAIYGDDPAQLLSMQTLEQIQAMGLLSTMRQVLEQWQEQDPNNIGVRRMLASLYTVQGESSMALDERRKATSLATAIGEDWFQLGLSEEQAGNANAANVDYNKALQCGDMGNTMHINYARQRLPQSDS